MLGSFKNGQPSIEIEVQGTAKPKIIEAIVDSGFNGYLKLPYKVAFPLGLVLDGTQTSTIADGSSAPHLVCSGKVCIDGTCVDATIDVSPSEIILLGTALLAKLKKSFFLDAHISKVEILPSAEELPVRGFAKLD